MSELVLNGSGTWGLRHVNNFELNDAGYGNGGWTFELVEVATGNVVKRWDGLSQVSPWDASSWGVTRVSWEGERLLVLYAPTEGLHSEPREERLALEDVVRQE